MSVGASLKSRIVLVGLLVFDSIAPYKSVSDTVTLIAAPTSAWPSV